MQRRKKGAAPATAESADADCNLEATTSDDAAPSAKQRSLADKDRHPMPWGLVIQDVFHINVREAYERLNAELTLGDQATEYGSVLHALDASSRNLFDAARLCRRAKLEDEKFKAELDMEIEVLRSAAQRALELEKAAGTKSKAPTLQDIRDRMLSTWPDKVTSIEARKQEMHGAFRAIEALEGAWRERCQALRVLANQFRSAGA